MNRSKNRLLSSPLSTRLMQAYGAACIVEYCVVRGISSSHIDELVRHLLQLLTSTDLPAWEAAGSRLTFSGQGDPLPDDLLNSIEAQDLEIFEQLVSNVVEIGLADMYGADTEEPLEALGRAEEILCSCGIEPPSISELHTIGLSEHGWGEPLSANQARMVELWCNDHRKI